MHIKNQTGTLTVMESFYTIQGEGFHQGKAAYFIRLAGCDVGCVWCDVKESWNPANHPNFAVHDIVRRAVLESGAAPVPEGRIAAGVGTLQTSPSKISESPWPTQKNTYDAGKIAVVTGGEPLLYDCGLLTEQLHEAGFSTHLETSGAYPLTGDWDWICLSPKKFKAPLASVLGRANELKVVIFNRSDFDWAEKNAALVSGSCKLYLQPEWSKSTAVTPLIIDYIKSNPGWQFSLQLHKYIAVP